MSYCLLADGCFQYTGNTVYVFSLGVANVQLLCFVTFYAELCANIGENVSLITMV